MEDLIANAGSRLRMALLRLWHHFLPISLLVISEMCPRWPVIPIAARRGNPILIMRAQSASINTYQVFLQAVVGANS